MEGITLERLQVIIEAYTKPYRDELDKVKKQTSSVTSQVERQTQKMRNSFRRVGGSGGIGTWYWCHHCFWKIMY